MLEGEIFVSKFGSVMWRENRKEKRKESVSRERKLMEQTFRNGVTLLDREAFFSKCASSPFIPTNPSILSHIPIDRLAAHAIAVGEVPALQHEGGNHTMELGPLVGELMTLLAHALLARAKRAEILHSLRDGVPVQPKDDAARGLGKRVRAMRRGRRRCEELISFLMPAITLPKRNVPCPPR